jgi:transcriptional regulator with XRE-family HTH domain
VRPTLQTVLKAARAKRHWSLRKAERETGIHNAHLAQIENGTIAKPDHNVLFALASTYGLDFEKLLQLAGHLRAPGTNAKRSPYGAVAWKAMTELDPDEQREVVDFIAELRRKRDEQA